MYRKTLLALIICGLMMLVAQPKSLFAATKPTLAGSWELTLTPNVPPTPAVEIAGLVTFTTDGSMVESDGTEVVNNGSPGHGIWQLLPSMTGFYISFTSLTFNADGSMHTTSVTVATVTETTSTNGTTFSGQFTTTTTGPSGVPPVTISGKLTGKLIPHPLLP